MHYTYLYLPESSVKFEGEESKAKELAEQYHMSIKEAGVRTFILTKDTMIVIFERDESNEILRQIDPSPYIRKSHPEYEEITEENIRTLINDLNRRKVFFDDLCK